MIILNTIALIVFITFAVYLLIDLSNSASIIVEEELNRDSISSDKRDTKYDE